MERKLGKIAKISAVIGGFLIMTGLIMLGVFSLSFFKIFNPDILVKEDILVILMWILLFIGILDLVSGIILLKKR